MICVCNAETKLDALVTPSALPLPLDVKPAIRVLKSIMSLTALYISSNAPLIEELPPLPIMKPAAAPMIPPLAILAFHCASTALPTAFLTLVIAVLIVAIILADADIVETLASSTGTIVIPLNLLTKSFN